MRPTCSAKTNILFLVIGLFFFIAGCTSSDDLWKLTLSKQQQAPGALHTIDSAIVQFMNKYHIPGMSVALQKNGNLVYAKGFGFADKEKKSAVTTQSLFRIGEVSCLVTAMAVMKLIEAGKLSMTSKIFGDSGVLKNEYGTHPYSTGITAITVYDLLQHTAGGWSGGDDPIYLPALRSASIDRAKLLSVTLDNVPLRSMPGKVFAYSNFGYFVLGMVIEKVSGQRNTDFVTKHVLAPAGIEAMCITADTETDKKKNEVHCYKEDTSIPFSTDEQDDDLFLSRSAACAGWLASAKDLVQLIATDNLDSTTKKVMLTPSVLNPHYACGWSYNNDFKNLYVISQIFGSTTEIVRAGNGYSWVLMTNTYRPAANDYISDLDNLMWQALADPGFLSK